MLIRSQPFAIPSHFIPATELDQAIASPLSTWWFVCQGSHILLIQKQADPTDAEPSYCLPQTQDLQSLDQDFSTDPAKTQVLGYLDNHPCIAAELPEAWTISKPFVKQSLRKLHGVISDDVFAIAARAVQIIAWHTTHQFCGRCATPTIQLPTERAKRCPNCELRQYPRLSPAVIMLISKGEQLLLARAPRFRNGMYSVLAGFVEPGESLEETVARETKEEVGIEVKNIRYFGSQPWPFPNSLMVGFTAEYAGGKIVPEPGEIEDAAWFNKTDLPPVPGELSIARKLIDWFVTQ